MSTPTEQVWLTKDAHNRLTRELAALLALREDGDAGETDVTTCLLYTSPSPRDRS